MEPSLTFLNLVVLLSLVCDARLIIKPAIRLGKPFQAE